MCAKYKQSCVMIKIFQTEIWQNALGNYNRKNNEMNIYLKP